MRHLSNGIKLIRERIKRLNKLAVLFPGQGSQYVSMGLDFYNRFESVRNLYNSADNILGYSLSKIIFEGSEDELKKTKHTQPAIMTTSVAIWRVIKEELGVTPEYMAGHSLGEYSAFTAAGNIKFEDSIDLVKNRGIYMDEASLHINGTMAAVMGINREELVGICEYVSKKGFIVQVANINTPSQIVISGEVKGVENACSIAKDKGARKIIPLSISGPFHSILMESAKEKLSPLVDKINLKHSTIKVVMNVTARPESNPQQIRNNLIEQVVSSVLWVDMIEWMINEGISTFIEVGPGKVLSGLVKKINNSVKIYSIEDVNSLNDIKEQLKVVS